MSDVMVQSRQFTKSSNFPRILLNFPQVVLNFSQVVLNFPHVNSVHCASYVSKLSVITGKQCKMCDWWMTRKSYSVFCLISLCHKNPFPARGLRRSVQVLLRRATFFITNDGINTFETSHSATNALCDAPHGENCIQWIVYSLWKQCFKTRRIEQCRHFTKAKFT